MGIYSTGQFLGIFAGGSMAGILYQWQGSSAIFITNFLVGGLWFLISISMKPNVYLSTIILPYTADEKIMKQLLKIPGIKEIAPAQEEQVIYIQVDKEHYKIGSAEKLFN